jgi:mannan endo-1,4-beta-mannosidase
LKRLRDAGVPVLWRPLHEASGNAWHTPWFWWGAKGAEPYKKLWNMMFDRMNNYHGLNNLIWIYSINWDNKDSSWYPGKN